MPEDSHLVECDPPRRREIGLDARPRRDLVTNRDKTWYLPLNAFHRLRKGVTKAFDQLKDRQVDIGHLATEQIGSPTLPQHRLKVAEIFRRAFVDKIIGVAFRFRFLIFIIKT